MLDTAVWMSRQKKIINQLASSHISHYFLGMAGGYIIACFGVNGRWI